MAPDGGHAGKDWGVERESYLDPVTGVRVTELATVGTSDNLYFHVSNFTADNRYVLFSSTRTGQRQFYRAQVETGGLVQLTADPSDNLRGLLPDHTNACRAFVMRGADVIALDIVDFTEREIGTIPGPHVGGFQQPSLSGDGSWLALTKQRDERTWEIGRMHVQTGEYRTVITQGFRIGHVQYSPADDSIFYVRETGGYAPQRTWLADADGMGNRPFYARTDSKTWITPLKEVVDKTGNARMVKEGDFWHVAARPDGKFLVIDDNNGRLWLMETSTGTMRLLATGLRDTVRGVHQHASFDRLGHYVQFHTGRTRETVAIIDLRDLPPLRW